MRWLGASYKNALKNKPCQEWVIYYHSECWQGKSQKRRELMLLPAGISATRQVWRAFLLGLCTRQLSYERLPSALLCSLSSLHSKPGCLEARTRRGAGKDHRVCGVLPTALISPLLVAKVNRKEDIEWAAFHCETFIIQQPSSPRFLNAFHPLHRVVLLLIVCSVRNRSSNLLSTYCIPCTKFFIWMISLDFQNWYE